MIAESADVLACAGTSPIVACRRGADPGKGARGVKLPKVAVLGNHDFEVGCRRRGDEILARREVTVLDGTSVEISGVGFAGREGLRRRLRRPRTPGVGRGPTKVFVREAVEETLKLESALARLRTLGRVVLLHYAPVLDTVEGEPREIYPFLGSSRLEEPLNRYAASVVFHGHAHRGQPEGKTSAGVPVYNVALPLLQQPLSGPVAVPGRRDSGAAHRACAATRHGQPRAGPMSQTMVSENRVPRPRRENTNAGTTTQRFYRRVLRELHAAGIEFLVGGGYALERYLGIGRLVKDLDLFLRADDVQKALDHLGARLGWRHRAHLPALARQGPQARSDHVDLIFNAGNGVCAVDDEWFSTRCPRACWTCRVLLCPVEEMIWSKAFVMERERFDGADVAHLLHACAGTLDWDSADAGVSGSTGASCSRT